MSNTSYDIAGETSHLGFGVSRVRRTSFSARSRRPGHSLAEKACTGSSGAGWPDGRSIEGELNAPPASRTLPVLYNGGSWHGDKTHGRKVLGQLPGQ
jgi:hypothetical protein